MAAAGFFGGHQRIDVRRSRNQDPSTNHRLCNAPRCILFGHHSFSFRRVKANTRHHRRRIPSCHTPQPCIPSRRSGGTKLPDFVKRKHRRVKFTRRRDVRPSHASQPTETPAGPLRMPQVSSARCHAILNPSPARIASDTSMHALRCRGRARSPARLTTPPASPPPASPSAARA